MLDFTDACELVADKEHRWLVTVVLKFGYIERFFTTNSEALTYLKDMRSSQEVKSFGIKAVVSGGKNVSKL